MVSRISLTTSFALSLYSAEQGKGFYCFTDAELEEATRDMKGFVHPAEVQGLGR